MAYQRVKTHEAIPKQEITDIITIPTTTSPLPSELAREPQQLFLNLDIRYLIYNYIIHDRTVCEMIAPRAKDFDANYNLAEQPHTRKIDMGMDIHKKNFSTMTNLSQTCKQLQEETEAWLASKPYLRKSKHPNVGIFDPRTTLFWINFDKIDAEIEAFESFARSNFFKREIYHVRIDFGSTLDIRELMDLLCQLGNKLANGRYCYNPWCVSSKPGHCGNPGSGSTLNTLEIVLKVKGHRWFLRNIWDDCIVKHHPL